MNSEGRRDKAEDLPGETKPEQVKIGGWSSSSVGEVIIRPEDAGSIRKLTKLEPEKQAAFFLAKAVGLVIAIATLAVLLDWMVKSPGVAMPPGVSQMDPEKLKSMIDNLKNLNDLSIDSSIKMFDTIVARSLLPVFTAILGYIFGARSETK